MPRDQHLRLLPPAICHKTIRELEELLSAAKAGQVVGIAYIALSAGSYMVDSVGEANERPTLTRGMIRELDDLLSARIRRR